MSDTAQDLSALQAICDRGVQLALAAGAEQAEIYAHWSRDREVTFEKNDLQTARSTEGLQLGLRVIRDQRSGFATTNQTASLQAALEEALQMAAVSPQDPWVGLASCEALPEERQLDEGLRGLGLEQLARQGVDLLREARGGDERIQIDSGALSSGHERVAIASSEGARAAFETQEASGYMFGMAVDGDQVGSFAYDGDAVQTLEELLPSLTSAFHRFRRKCLGALDAQPGESFRGPVILPPDVVSEFLLSPLLVSLGADQVRKGRSPLKDRCGEAIASSSLTLWEGGSSLDGFRHPGFDREGRPRQRRALIRDGVLSDYLWTSYEARAAGRDESGQASGGASSAPYVGPGLLEIPAGELDWEQLEQVPRAVLITRFAGTTDPVSGDFSGVVKGGFLIRHGERTPIKEVTVAGNLYDCLKQISGYSRQRWRMYGQALFPALRIEDLSITAG